MTCDNCGTPTRALLEGLGGLADAFRDLCAVDLYDLLDLVSFAAMVFIPVGLMLLAYWLLMKLDRYLVRKYPKCVWPKPKTKARRYR